MKKDAEAKTPGFLPDGYEPPKSSSRYTKFEDGKTTRFRIMDFPYLGWVYWDKTERQGKPIRLQFTEENLKRARIAASENLKDEDRKVNHFWALKVYNYETKQMEVLEITQKTIQSAITSYINDEEYGSPINYDIKITKKKENDRTTYDISPGVPKIVSKEAQDAFEETPINLEALFYSADPFDTKWFPEMKNLN